MRFPRQASMASRTPLSPLPTNSPASHKLVRTAQAAAKETRKGNESSVDLETWTECTDEPMTAPATICRRNDGRAWRCKNPVAKGSTLCGHHLARYAARGVQGPAAASAARGSRCPLAGGAAEANDTTTKKKRTATKSQKFAEKKSTHEVEKAMAMDPEIYNAACILYHCIAGFWSEGAEVSHEADDDDVLVEEMNSGDDDEEEEEDDGVEDGDHDQHSHEGFLSSSERLVLGIL